VEVFIYKKIHEASRVVIVAQIRGKNTKRVNSYSCIDMVHETIILFYLNLYMTAESERQA